eukprot:gnl/TRDRNA2_/TRDRNA2_174900_c9_seq4.p1 gnl/TRDRNA2_/TRDRNA2_174900_c9~~gnl/TRDRNA2_/TRDRNA2_174900_c9_seq4.p1  ORF type:complete len:144 (-),score=5.51 gnl/TRDRNA2_/TRDRNA2_174900_c9_seq4:562-933(-)
MPHKAILRLRSVKQTTKSSATLAKVVNSSTSGCLTERNAHAVLARFFALKSPMLLSAAVARGLNNDESVAPTLANAHATLARSCALKLLMRSSAARANTETTLVSKWPEHTSAQTVFTKHWMP